MCEGQGGGVKKIKKSVVGVDSLYGKGMQIEKCILHKVHFWDVFGYDSLKGHMQWRDRSKIIYWQSKPDLVYS